MSEMIDELNAKIGPIVETPKLFTEDEFNKKLTQEVDRRVESGIQKGLETQKQKWELELQEKAKMTAEEIAKKEFEEKLNGLTQKEKEIQKKANKIDAMDMLSEAQIPKSHYDKFLNMLVSDDSETTKANVQSFVEMFNSTKTEIETKVKSEFTNVPKPQVGMGDGVVTKSDFDKMSYADKLAFKQKNPEQFKEFMK